MSIDFRIRDFFAPKTLISLHRILERTQWMPAAELEEYQQGRLMRVLDQAFLRVPYYRRLLRSCGLTRDDFKTAGDLRQIPLLRKEALRRFLPRLLADDAERHGPKFCTTSGTTGSPVSFYLDRTSNALEFVYYWRHWSWAGYRLGNRFAELSSHFFLARPHLRSRNWVFQPHLRRLILNGMHLSPADGPEMAAAIRNHRVKFLKGLASGLYFLAYSLLERGIEDLQLQGVFSTGEVVTPMHRELIEQAFSCKVLDSYGHMERTVAISQCREGGYHVNSDYGLLEIDQLRVDPNGTEVGRVVGSSLYNLAMPLIRYDTGDEIELASNAARCPCGRTLPLVSAIRGRVSDVIVTPEGKFVTALFIVPEMIQGVKFIQFIQSGPARLDILVAPPESLDSDIRSRILDQVRSMVGSSMRVSLTAVPEADLIRDASGKTRTVIGRGLETIDKAGFRGQDEKLAPMGT